MYLKRIKTNTNSQILGIYNVKLRSFAEQLYIYIGAESLLRYSLRPT